MSSEWQTVSRNKRINKSRRRNNRNKQRNNTPVLNTVPNLNLEQAINAAQIALANLAAVTQGTAVIHQEPTLKPVENVKQVVKPVEDDVKIQYQVVRAKGHNLNIHGKTAAIPGQIVCTGAYTLPANTIDFRTILNLTEFFFPKDAPHLFSNKYAAGDVFQTTRNYLDAHREEVLSKMYFIAAINGNKQSGKRDLPNVNAAVVSWLLEHLPHDTIFMDPIDFLNNPMLATTTHSVKLTNFTAVVSHIRDKLAYPIPIDTSARGKNTAVTFVNYQRGRGTPQPDEKQRILNSINDQNASFLNVRLTPGKYDYIGATAGMPKMCYDEFPTNVAQLVNQFTDFKEYLDFTNKKAIRCMYLVMDEFSGYSMFTVAALKGFGLDRITTVLCYHNGKYLHANM